MSSELAAILLGLVSAASWGAADFSGGVATRRTNVYTVIIFSQLVGIVILIGLAVLLSAHLPASGDIILGSIAGISGAIGLIFLYRGLAGGSMAIVAPIAALVTAIIPVFFGIINEGLPSVSQLLGFILALTGVWLISQTGSKSKISVQEITHPVIAGFFFGLFFILIDQLSGNAILWPLAAARIASVIVMIVIALTMRRRELPAVSQVPIIALAGLLDVGGNVFFALATTFGRLDIASVLASLYPASTVLLAYTFLKERLTIWQWFGISLALVAVALISL